MEIIKEEINDVVVLSLGGRLDALSAPDLEKALNQEASKKVLVDCLVLDYISSAGLRVLLSGAKNAKKSSGSIALSSLSTTVKQVFEISGFTSIFSLYASKDEALKSL